MRNLLILFSFLSVSSEVFAHNGRRGHRHRNHRPQKPEHVARPDVIVYEGSRPWSPQYTPPRRSDHVWVPGHHRGNRWVPGHWRPTSAPPRAGAVYVPGHWVGETYVDGYWRDETRSSHRWSDGRYEDDGTWVEGGWVLTDEDGTEVIIMDQPSGDESNAPAPPDYGGGDEEGVGESGEIEIIFVDDPDADGTD